MTPTLSGAMTPTLSGAMAQTSSGAMAQTSSGATSTTRQPMSPRPAVRTVQITFDCADPDQLAQFWCAALGYVMDPPPDGFDSWDSFLEARRVPEDMWNARSGCSDPNQVGPRLFFQRVPEAKHFKNRVHLDVRVAPGLVGEQRMAALDAEADRLEALGGARLRVGAAEMGSEAFIVMADPEGNEFCLD